MTTLIASLSLNNDTPSSILPSPPLHPHDSLCSQSSGEACCNQLLLKYLQLSLELQLLVQKMLVVPEECLLGTCTVVLIDLHKCLWFINHWHIKIICYSVSLHLFVCTALLCLFNASHVPGESIRRRFLSLPLTCLSITYCFSIWKIMNSFHQIKHYLL